jgi:hypothetical protein
VPQEIMETYLMITDFLALSGNIVTVMRILLPGEGIMQILSLTASMFKGNFKHNVKVKQSYSRNRPWRPIGL